MRKYTAVLLLALGSNVHLHAEESVFIGHVLEQEQIESVRACEEGVVCMRIWTRWTVAIKRNLRGPVISGRVVAARLQHGDYASAYLARIRCSTVRPIEDAEDRKLLGVNYKLLDISTSGDQSDMEECAR